MCIQIFKGNTPPYHLKSKNIEEGTFIRVGSTNRQASKEMIAWDKTHKRLQDHHFRFMWNVANNKHPLDERAKKYALNNLKTLKKYGFIE